MSKPMPIVLSVDGSTVWVNPEHIMFIVRYATGGFDIRLSNGHSLEFTSPTGLDANAVVGIWMQSLKEVNSGK